MLSLRGLEQAVAISSLCFVILSETKDLKACTIIHRLVVLEILHFVQNDNTGRHCEGFSPWQSLAALCHTEQREASPRSLPETALIARSQRGDSSLHSE